MNINLLLGVLAAILGVFSIVLFGRPKGDQSTADPGIEQVESPPSLPQPEFTPELPPPGDNPGANQPELPEIPDPWANNDIEDTATPADRAKAMAASQAAAPPSAALSMPPFAAIHDPKRPSTAMLQDLSQEIISMGTSQKLQYFSKLEQYCQHDDGMMRCYVAHAMGQIAAANVSHQDNSVVIRALGELLDDPEEDVRQMSLKALSRVSSGQALPYLEKGVLGASGYVKQLAEAAIQQLKQSAI